MVSEKTNPRTNSKKLSVPFILALVFCPMISAWFTLREGYSKEVRFAAFTWMFVSFIIVSIDNHKNNNSVLQEDFSNDIKINVEQAKESEITNSKVDATTKNTLNKFKNPRKSVSDSVYKPYDSVNNKLVVQQFGHRLSEIQKLRERFAERAVHEGLCKSVQMSEVALDSNPNNPSFYIWCKQKGNDTVQFYANESQIKYGELQDSAESGLSESEAITKCSRLIKDNTRNLSKVKVHYLADAVFQKYNDGTGNTKAVIGFTGKNLLGQKVSYRGFCEFDKKGGVKSFSINH